MFSHLKTFSFKNYLISVLKRFFFINLTSLVGLPGRIHYYKSINLLNLINRPAGVGGKPITLVIIILVLLTFRNSQAAWIPQSSGTTSEIWGMNFLDANTGFFAGGGGTIKKTINGGNNWSNTSTPGFQVLRGIIMRGGGNVQGVAAGHSGAWRTTNDGANWVNTFATGSYYSMDILWANQNIYCVGQSMSYAKTADWGATWTTGTFSVSGTAGFDIYSVDITNASTIYICGSSVNNAGVNTPKICRSTDGGSTFSILVNFPTGVFTGASLNDIEFYNSGPFGYACGSNGRILRTTNSGTSWDTTNLGSVDIRQIAFESSSKAYVCGSGGQVFYTTNSGANWTASTPTGTTNNLRCISYAGNYLWSAGASGTLIRNFVNPNNVTVTGALNGNGNYETLSDAFSAINSSSQSGANISVTVNTNTTEPASGAVLNNGVWSSLSIQPKVGSAITVSGNTNNGIPLIDLNGADKVTIDGISSGGSSLTIINTTVLSNSGTSTVRFKNDATNNLITRCKISGSTRSNIFTPCANILFDGNASVTGNDNNVVSYCDIAPAGANLPSVAVYFTGTNTTTALNNSNDTIRNCNIYDYFASTGGGSTGIYIGSGNTATSITDNKFYQTASRTSGTGSSDHSAIQISNTSGNDFRITGNTIGYSSSAGTGVYAYDGRINSNFYGITVNAATSSLTEISNNIVNGIQITGAMSGATFINNIEGLFNVYGNTIGSLTLSNSISFSSSNSFTQISGIKNSGTANSTVSQNIIGGISAVSPACILTGLNFSSSGSSLWNCNNNIVGGTVTNSIQNQASGIGSFLSGISVSGTGSSTVCQLSGNIIQNMQCDNPGTVTNAGLAGVYVNIPSGSIIAGNNNIHSLTNINNSVASQVSGIMIYNCTGTFNSNSIYSLKLANSSSYMNGIYIFGGNSNFINNMISLGIDSSGISESNGCSIYGIKVNDNGANNLYFNSVYIGGNPSGGSSNTFALYSIAESYPRNYLNNIFYNGRSNSGSAGKHYSISAAGTTPNPSGLICNYNDLYVSGTGGVMGYFNNADVPNLSAWKTLTGKDSNSVSVNPKFIGRTNLHIDSTKESSLNSAGIPVAGISNDFDNNTRNISIPDIGADEFNLSIKGEALNFDGTNDFVTLPNTLTQTFTGPTVTEFTIEYWFKGTNLQSAVRFQTNGSNFIVAGWGTIPNQKHIISSDGGTGGGVKVGNGIYDGNWHHIAVTWKRNTVNGFRSYLDGALVEAKNAADVSLPAISTGGSIGYFPGNPEYMNGSLDEVRIWTKALSQTEIAVNRFHEIDSASNLLASYHFNQGIGGGNNSGITSLSDFTGNYNSTLYNFALTGSISNWINPGPGFCSPDVEININCNGNPVADGDITPSVSDNTDFGTVSADTFTVKFFTIQNFGIDSLSIGTPLFTGSDSNKFFAGPYSVSGKIPPGGISTFSITFSPASSGIKNAVVHIPNNDCDEYEYDFALTGTGTSAPAHVLNFDGTDDYVALPNTLTQNLTAPSVSEITIEYWFKGSQIQSAVRFQTGSSWIVAGWGNPGSEKHLISTEDGTNGISVGAGVSDGNWHHVAMTWKKNTVNGFKSYLDGNLVEGRNSSNTDLPNMNVSGYLGRYNGTREWTNGSLDEVRIWTRELPQSEISANRFLEISYGNGLLASYHFNQGLAGDNNTGITTLTDATSNNFTGILNNFALNGITSNFLSPGPALTQMSTTINISAIPEGFYNSSTDMLNMTDTMRAYIHSNTVPFNVIDSAKGILDSITHSGAFIFNNVPNGNYYIRLVHRNCIETWSAAPQTLGNYDFTASASQAFGNNMIQVDTSPLRYALFSGDVNKDGTIDLNDVLQIYNDANNFSAGYIVTDLNGDRIVDLNDLLISYNNSAGFVALIRP